MNTTKIGMLIAASAATLLASGLLLAGDAKKGAEAKVNCAGINACKGQGACAGDGHGCAGVNTCKGKGWIQVTAKECTDKKGTVIGDPHAPKAAPAPAHKK